MRTGPGRHRAAGPCHVMLKSVQALHGPAVLAKQFDKALRADQVLGADGAPVAGLWTLGALRTGTLWESVAMPELRGQAARLAEAALAGLEASH